MLAADGAIVGSGFLLTPTLGVTCAHVVEETRLQSGEAVRIHFHLADQPCDGLVREAGFSPFEERDIAFIELSAPQPGTEPVVMGSSVGWGRAGMTMSRYEAMQKKAYLS